jgi:hypothetical protein
MTRGSQGTFLKTGIVAAKKKSIYSFSGMLKKGDVDNDADDDVRNSVSQTHAKATLSTQEFFLKTHNL